MATLDERIAAFGTSISSARKNIISAIVAKGVSCANTVKLSALPSYIAKIVSAQKLTSTKQHVNVSGATASTTSSYTATYGGVAYYDLSVNLGEHTGGSTDQYVILYKNGTAVKSVYGNSSSRTAYGFITLAKGDVLKWSYVGKASSSYGLDVTVSLTLRGIYATA